VRNFHAFNSAQRASVTSNVPTLQPGCTFTFIVPAGQIADLKIDAIIGGNNTATGATDRTIVDAIIYQNGTFLAQGGWNRVSCNNSSGGGNAFFTTTMTTWSSGLTAGTYTINLMTARFSGNTPVNIGGNCALDTDCGEIHGTLYYR
jgi:hypothetical protein